MIRAQDEKGDATDDITNLDRAFLLQRIKLPAGDTSIGLSAETRTPHEGHRTSTAQITYLNNNRLGGGTELRLDDTPQLVHNLEIGGAHTYFAGDSHIEQSKVTTVLG